MSITKIRLEGAIVRHMYTPGYNKTIKRDLLPVQEFLIFCLWENSCTQFSVYGISVDVLLIREDSTDRPQSAQQENAVLT